MDYANLIIIAYEFTYTCLNCVNLCADDCLVLGGVQSLRLSIALGPLCSLPQPCRRYGCGGCAGGTAVMGNPMFSRGEA